MIPSRPTLYAVLFAGTCKHTQRVTDSLITPADISRLYRNQTRWKESEPAAICRYWSRNGRQVRVQATIWDRCQSISEQGNTVRTWMRPQDTGTHSGTASNTQSDPHSFWTEVGALETLTRDPVDEDQDQKLDARGRSWDWDLEI
eukprot:3592146-Rhodomonas_salina.2